MSIRQAPSDDNMTDLGLRLRAFARLTITRAKSVVRNGRASFVLLVGTYRGGQIGAGMGVIVGALFALLGASLYYAWRIWTAFGAAEVPVWIYAAVAGGVLFSLVVGCGLMALMFYSSRAGYDDAAGRCNPDSGPEAD